MDLESFLESSYVHFKMKKIYFFCHLFVTFFLLIVWMFFILTKQILLTQACVSLKFWKKKN